MPDVATLDRLVKALVEHPDEEALAAIGDGFPTRWAPNGPTTQPTGRVVNLADKHKERP